jgi:hypothetical protein
MKHSVLTHYAFPHKILASCVALSLAVFITACSGNSTPRDSVWNSYDHRHPVPEASGLPASSYQRYYQDNDDYYTPPSDFGCDPDNLHMCE